MMGIGSPMPLTPHPPSDPRGFDFTHHMRCLCADMVSRLPELSHIDLTAVAISFSQARKAVPHGLLAALTPMRFEAGSLTMERSDKTYTVQRLYNNRGNEILYILSFYLPRFLNHSFEEKLATILHELWHISPDFNGDLRRYQGRCYVHGPSQNQYDAIAEQLAKKWQSQNPPSQTFAFLRLNFHQLVRRYGPVYGVKIPAPKLLPTSGKLRSNSLHVEW